MAPRLRALASNLVGRGPPKSSVERRAALVAELARRGIRDKAVLNAIGNVPREDFVPAELADRAYGDHPLPIGRRQTISQPYIVARMTEALALSERRQRHGHAHMRVLDVGTGSGYQAAVLAELGAQVYGIEIDEELAAGARARLQALGYEVDVTLGDGTLGRPGAAPYAGIVVAAAIGYPPPPLVEQLADGGRLVAPIGSRWRQTLTVIELAGETLRERRLDPCAFVPLVGRYGLPEEFF